MKKYKINKNKPFIAIALAIFGLAIFSCEDDDKNLYNDFSTDGGFIRFVDNSPPTAVGVDQISDLVYAFAVEDANKNISSYDLKIYADLSGSRTDTVDIEIVTSFPKSFSFNASDLASLLGVTVDDISFGDNFFFTGTVTTNDGSVFSGANRLNLIEIFEQPDGTYLDDEDPDEGDPVTIGPTDEIVTSLDGSSTFLQSGLGVTDDILDEAGYRQAFEFNFIILCPSVDYSVFPGEWDVVTHAFDAFFGPQGDTRTIIAGPEDNQITIVGGAVPLDGADDLIIEIDASNSQISFAGDSENDIHFNTFGPGVYGDDVTGLAFTCIGRLEIVITSPGFIPNTLILTKSATP